MSKPVTPQPPKKSASAPMSPEEARKFVMGIVAEKKREAAAIDNKEEDYGGVKLSKRPESRSESGKKTTKFPAAPTRRCGCRRSGRWERSIRSSRRSRRRCTALMTAPTASARCADSSSGSPGF